MAAIGPQNDASDLLDLAPELRNRIYDFALVEDSLPINIVLTQYNPPRGLMNRIREPALLSTCRQIRPEALAIYYGDNTFVSDEWFETHWFLASLPREKLRMLWTIQKRLTYAQGLREEQFNLRLAGSRLADMKFIFGGTGLLPTVFQWHLQIENEGTIWVSNANVEEFELKRIGDRRAIVRKAKDGLDGNFVAKSSLGASSQPFFK